MSGYDTEKIQSLIGGHMDRPMVAVETGILLGDTTRKMSGMFRHVISIDIATGIVEAATTALADLKNVELILGDSAQVVPELAKSIHEPVLWYLDAHWFPGANISRENPFPLWDELDAIAARTYPDIVMVDDVHAFGRDDWGCDHPAGVVERWGELSEEAIVTRLGRVVKSLIAMDKVVCYLDDLPQPHNHIRE